MTDKYLNAVNNGLTKTIAKRLGLPRPPILRRDAPGTPLLPGPVLIVASAASAADSDAIAKTLLGWDLDVRRHHTKGEKLGAIVAVLTELDHPSDLQAPVLAASPALKDLLPGGRVVTVSRPMTPGDAPAKAAARNAVEALTRSLAKELRYGATGNGITLAEGVDISAPSLAGAMRFLLSARSAFVDGQFIRVTSQLGSAPEDEAGWSRPLSGKLAVVTGAARGIGAAIAKQLRRDGADLIVIDVPAAGEGLATVANRVRGIALQLDITAPDAGERIAAAAAARGRKVDILVHNAGITRDKLLANMAEDRWAAVLGVNIIAQLSINDQLLAAGAFAPGARVVAMASTSGIAGNRGQTNYGASKAGVIGMVKATAPIMAELGGTANAVAPGFIETDMTAAMPMLSLEIARRASSLMQGGQPGDVAATIAFLVSPAAGGINGSVLRVCGQNMVGR